MKKLELPTISTEYLQELMYTILLPSFFKIIMATAVPIIVASIVLAIIRKKVRSRNVRLISEFFIKIVTLAIIGITVTTTI